MKRHVWFAFVVGAVMLIPAQALAVGLYAGDEVVIDSKQVSDVYGAGGMIKVLESIDGDAVFAGGVSTIDNDITGDLVIAGGQVTVNGDIGDDIIVLGGNVTVNGKVGDDLAGAAGQVTLSKDAHVVGDIVMAGGLMDLGGTVDGSVHVFAGQILMSGHVRGDMKAQYNESLSFEAGSHVDGSLYYVARRELSVPEGTIGGTVVYTPFLGTMTFAERDRHSEPFGRVFASLWWIALTMIVATGFTLLMRPAVVRIGSPSLTKVGWKRLGWGLLVLIGGPLLALVLCVTIIGIPLALIVGALWMLLIFFGAVFASLIVGTLLLPIDEDSSAGRILGSFFVGGLILAVLYAIPVIGFLAKAFSLLLALGALVLYRWETLQYLRKNNMA